MGIIRNFINVVGIVPENELPKNIQGQAICYSDVETIFIPENKADVKSIYEIMVEVEIKSTRTINSSLGKLVIIDGIKKHKIIYTENGETEKASILYLDTPYNTFIELPNDNYDININNDLKIYIVDAYFDLIASRKIYSHIVYLVDLKYNSRKNTSIKVNTKSNKINKNKLIDVVDMTENLNVQIYENYEQNKSEISSAILNEVLISKEENYKYNEIQTLDIDGEYL